MFKRVFVLLLVLGLAANASAALVASYDFEEGSGTVLDGTTNNYDGTQEDGGTWSTDAKNGNYSLDLTDAGTGGKSSNVDLGDFIAMRERFGGPGVLAPTPPAPAPVAAPAPLAAATAWPRRRLP